MLVIPTDLPGVVRRPFPSICGIDDLDFNEVFLTDVRVPAENLVGPLNGGWGVANGSLGHERTMMWLGFADRIHNVLGDFRPRTPLERDQFASGVMDYHALRLMGSQGLAKAARGETDVAGVSVVKLFGSEAELRLAEHALTAAGPDGLMHPAMSGPYAHMNLDHYFASWFERVRPQFLRHHRRWNLGDSAQHHRSAGAGPAARQVARVALIQTPGTRLLALLVRGF